MHVSASGGGKTSYGKSSGSSVYQTSYARCIAGLRKPKSFVSLSRTAKLDIQRNIVNLICFCYVLFVTNYVNIVDVEFKAL
ncbi:MAG: hypothetical protein ACI4UK_02430 [Floccifex sp.]